MADWVLRATDTAAGMMGYIEDRANGREINMRQRDATGDWTLDDKYVVNQNGQIVSLMRTIIYFSDDERKETLYRINNGRAIIVQNSAYSLKTKSPLILPLPMDQYESWTIYTRVEDLPFSGLLKDLRRIPKAGAYCLATSTQ